MPHKKATKRDRTHHGRRPRAVRDNAAAYDDAIAAQLRYGAYAAGSDRFVVQVDDVDDPDDRRTR